MDYITFPVWAKNWGWYDYAKADSTYPLALAKIKQYYDDHLAVARTLNKPIVLEEFGLARDNEVFSTSSAVHYRDNYFNFASDYLLNSVKNNDLLVGANIWHLKALLPQ